MTGGLHCYLLHLLPRLPRELFTCPYTRCAGCICLTFLQPGFTNVFSNCLSKIYLYIANVFRYQLFSKWQPNYWNYRWCLNSSDRRENAFGSKCGAASSPEWGAGRRGPPPPYMIIVADIVCGAKNLCGEILLHMTSNFAPHDKSVCNVEQSGKLLHIFNVKLLVIASHDKFIM